MSYAVVRVQDEAAKKINTALGELVETAGQNLPENDYPWLLFLLGNTKYAINTRYVTRVSVLYEIVPFMNAPAYCSGVVWDRDGMIRLLDLCALFGEGNYLSAIRNGKNKLPMIIVILLNKKRYGVIVDEIVTMECLSAKTQLLTEQDSARARYIRGMINYDWWKAPALVISPESFSVQELEDSDAKIDWKGRIDMKLKLESSL